MSGDVLNPLRSVFFFILIPLCSQDHKTNIQPRTDSHSRMVLAFLFFLFVWRDSYIRLNYFSSDSIL